MSDNSTYVDPNTDDLDAFNDLLNGAAKPLVENQEATEDDETQLAEDDDSKIEDDTLATDEDDSDEDIDDEADDEDEEEEAPVQKKKTFQDRINELTAKAREAERREADLARKLEETIARLDKTKEPEPDPKPAQRAAQEGPSFDDINEDGSAKYPLGEFDPNYVADLARFTIRKEFEDARNAEKAAAEEAKLEEAKQELQAQWQTKIEAAEERLPDFRETVQSFEEAFVGIDPAYGEYLAGTIMAMEYGSDVLYYLSNNIAEAKKIAASGPTQATIALGRLEARFELADEQKEVKKIKVSKAPAPPPSNTKGNKGSKEIPDDTDDLDAFEAKFYSNKRR